MMMAVKVLMTKKPFFTCYLSLLSLALFLKRGFSLRVIVCSISFLKKVLANGGS
jgi:hypothetical protein